MCSPVLFVAGGLQVAGGVMQAGAQLQAGREQQAYYNYLAEQDKVRAKVAREQGDREANAAQTKGAFDTARLKRNTREFAASQVAAAAANGIGGSVTAQDLALDTFEKGKLDEMAIRYNADQAAWAAKTGADYQAWDFENQSVMNRAAGSQARSAAKRNAAASLLGGATQAFGTYANYKTYGPR